MNRLKVCLTVGSIALAGFTACGDDDDATDTTPMIDAATPMIDAEVPELDADPAAPDADLTPETFEVDTDITANTTWTYPDTYILKKHVFVKNGATLTIEPGVIVKGEGGTSLVITREGKIDAAGTAERPITFTSAKAVGSRAPGDWGGVVVLGKARINDIAGQLGIEGFPAGTADVAYGGTDDTHDCGTLKYARIQFAGFVLEQDKELNGLTVGACGSQTEFDYIQLQKGSDDGVEFFGGTANIKHLVIAQGLDDGLDWDMGWTGHVQFAVIQIGNGDGECGFEADNHPTNFDLTPRSQPVIANATIVGPDSPAGKTKIGMLFRRGTAAQVYNTIVMNVNGLPIDVRDAASVSQTPANLFVKNSIFFGNGGQASWNDTTDNDGGFDEGAFFRGPALQNREVDPQIAGATSAAPTFKPAAASPALTGAATLPAGFDAAPFVGAIGAQDWTAGWTEFPQN